MNLSTQTKMINLIIMSQKIDNKLIKDIEHYLQEYSNQYALILHDKDILESGELKKKHLHIIYEKKSRVRLSTELNIYHNQFSININAMSIEKCKDFVGSLQYLVHKKNIDKYQYNISDIITNINDNELQTLMSIESKTISYEYLKMLIINSDSVLDIIENIGLNQYRLWRQVIRDMCVPLCKQLIGL